VVPVNLAGTTWLGPAGLAFREAATGVNGVADDRDRESDAVDPRRRHPACSDGLGSGSAAEAYAAAKATGRPSPVITATAARTCLRKRDMWYSFYSIGLGESWGTYRCRSLRPGSCSGRAYRSTGLRVSRTCPRHRPPLVTVE
jgi:hypothetical protein